MATTYYITAYWHDPRWKKFVGASVKIWDLAKNLAEMGNDVVLFLPRYGFNAAQVPFTIIEVPFLNMSGCRSLSYNIMLFWYMLFKGGIKRPDIIYLRRTSLIVPLVYARLRRACFFFEVNDDPYATTRQEGGRTKFFLRSGIGQLVDRLNLKAADRSFVISAELIDKIQRHQPSLPPERLIILPSGTNTDLLNLMKKEDACRQLDLKEDDFYIGFVGTLLAHQGIEYLIKAAPSILARQPRCHFLIVGDGPEKTPWMALARENGLDSAFSFVGEVGYESVGIWINAMDVCLAPYVAPAGLRSPVKIFDYLACGKPVVASRIEGTTDTFKAAPLVRLIAPESSGAIAETVLSILNQQPLALTERQRARDWVKTHYDRRKMARRVAAEAKLCLAGDTTEIQLEGRSDND